MQEFFSFLDKGVSPYHAVNEVERILQENGFEKLQEQETWNLQADGKYYVTRNQSSILAFQLPKGAIKQYHMTASHSDSPTFRIKKAKVEDKYYAKAEVEGYGGMIMSSWFDRPLTFAGRVVVRTPEGVATRLITMDKDLFVIPNVAIHFNREINKGYAYNAQIDLQPIYGGKDSDFNTMITKAAGVEPADILDMDMVLTVRQKAGKLGVEDEFYMAPRVDDLACAYTTLKGFVTAGQPECTANIWCMFDNEEVGSGSRQGALGNFLSETLGRLEESLKIAKEESAIVRSRSLLISADNAHAVHPNHPEKTDSEFPVELNKGIVIKYSANQKYTTTGMTAAVLEELCSKHQVPVQKFANRADTPGGSTLGNLLSQQVSVPMVDIGLPQLAMHSAVETAGCQDVAYMITAMKAFYESEICQEKDGTWRV